MQIGCAPLEEAQGEGKLWSPKEPGGDSGQAGAASHHAGAMPALTCALLKWAGLGFC